MQSSSGVSRNPSVKWIYDPGSKGPPGIVLGVVSFVLAMGIR